MFGSHHKDYTRNRRLLKKDRHKFKSGEKYQVSLEKEKRVLELKQLSEEELAAYKKKMHERLRRERRQFWLKMLIGTLILGGLFYWLALVIF